MGGEVELAAEVVPVATAAIGLYGRAVLAKATDDVADVTIRAGLRLLQRVFGARKQDEALPDVLADVIAHPKDGDVVAAFRLAIRKALEADPELAGEVAALVASRTPAARISQRVVSGRDSYVSGHDMQVTRRPD